MRNLKKGFERWLVLTVLLSSIVVSAQKKEEFKPIIKWNLSGQIWLRYSDLNDGSEINGEQTTSYTDVSIRRLRIPISSQVTPKIFLYSIIGGNNYNMKNTEMKIGILDLYAEYSFAKYLEVGIGKSGWQGLNRWNIRSSSTLMGLDSPLFTLNTVEKNDDLGRQYGVWFKGQAARFDYRLTFNKPDLVATAPSGSIDFANNRPRLKTSAYVKYQFFEHESNKSAYQVGTYMQNKKVFNIGAGFQYQEKAMSNGNASDENTEFYDMEHWAVDSFLNLPMANKDAITAYLGYYYYGFGKGYLRNVGANNITSGGDVFTGSGVAFPMIGTGGSIYMQFGYAFEKTKILGEEMIIQPNISIQHSDWDALEQNMTVYDFNVNFMINGKHSNKISLGYQLRPIFDATTLKQKDAKGMAVLQYQIALK
ncbi:porin [Flavicella sp.]|uniref:porin n=1 Tax=Flavicella sp. TaxID=2957742 RepID=UPI00262D229C|nr:porin [Flavicella sp.]MDG1804394.1 porin [Flavicella sp.]